MHLDAHTSIFFCFFRAMTSASYSSFSASSTARALRCSSAPNCSCAARHWEQGEGRGGRLHQGNTKGGMGIKHGMSNRGSMGLLGNQAPKQTDYCVEQ